MHAAAPPRAPSSVAVAAAALGVAVATVVWRVLTFSGFNNDHYIYLAGAQQMVLGEWPVRDFVDPGWPLMNAVSGLARLVFGRQLIVELLLVSTALALGAACTVVASARLSRSAVVAAGVGVLEVVINPRSFGYPKIALYAAAACAFVSFTKRPSRRGVVLLAALSACAFLFRHDHGLYIGVGALVAVLLGYWHEGARIAAARAGLFAAASALLLLPWAIFVQYYVGIAGYLRPALAFSRAEAEATLIRTLPALDAGQSWLSRDNAGVLLFYLFHAIPVVSLLLAGIRARQGRERWRGEAAAVAAIALMALPMNAGFLRSPLLARVPDAVVPAAVLGAWLLGLALDARRWPARSLAIGAAACAWVAVAAAVGSMADLRNELNRIGLLNRRGSFERRVTELESRLSRVMPDGNHIPSRNSTALLAFFGYVKRCSNTDDRIVMTGLSPDVYVLAERGFAGGQMAFRPNFYAAVADQRRALARMARQSVPFFVLSLEEERDFREQLALISAYLDAHYEPLADIPVPGTLGLRLYAERGRHSAGLDLTTGWPCYAD